MPQALKKNPLTNLTHHLNAKKSLYLKSLTLGLITTILTTWTCAYFAIPLRRKVEIIGRSDSKTPCLGLIKFDALGTQMYMSVDIPDDEGDDLTGYVNTVNLETISFPHWVRTPSITDPLPPDRVMVYNDIASGWPLLALSYTDDRLQDRFHHKGPMIYDSIAIKGGIDLGQSMQDGPLGSHVLAYKPILPGLIINTVFYATILFAIPTLTFQTIRTHHRQKNNRCPKCKYDLRATNPNTPCPECGNPISNPSASAKTIESQKSSKQS